MELAWQPLLRVQRDLYDIPRGMERFREYLAALIDPEGGDLKLPLSGMNPMGKEHVPAFLDRLLAADAEGAGARALELARPLVKGAAGSFRACLVASDDVGGGWTQRFAGELAYRRGQRALFKRGWLAATLWTSETYGPEGVEAAVLEAVFRAEYAGRNGYATTLGELLDQEGEAMGRAGSAAGRKIEAEDPGEMDYTRAVLAPLLGAGDEPTLIAALFGDEAAKSLGHRPRGFPPARDCAWRSRTRGPEA